MRVAECHSAIRQSATLRYMEFGRASQRLDRRSTSEHAVEDDLFDFPDEGHGDGEREQDEEEQHPQAAGSRAWTLLPSEISQGG